MKTYIISTLLLFVCSVILASDYYVDTDRGDDEAAGTNAMNAWKTLDRVNTANLKPGDHVLFKSGQVWRGMLKVQSGEIDNPIVYTSFGRDASGENMKPRIIGSVDLADPSVWQQVGENLWRTLPDEILVGSKSDEFIQKGWKLNCKGNGRAKPEIQEDVGNIILVKKGSKEKFAAFKHWNMEALKKQGDFYCDPFGPESGPRTVYFYSQRNPAEVYGFIEAAQKIHTASMSDRKWFVIDGLAFGYTGAHGIKGTNAQNVIIKNCDFFWIGGSHLYTRNDVPTRYGNGIEFWCAADNCLVKNCRFWQIYDTAMTNQGPDACLVRNIVWEGNTIYLCEQAYEIWLSNPKSEVEGLIYRNNRSFDCGFGWSHVQRPNKRGTHLLAYRLESGKVDIRYQENIFYNAVDNAIWFLNPRLNEIDCNNNIYWQDGTDPEKQKLFMWGGQESPGVPFDEYREKTGNDTSSRFEKVTRIEYFDY